MTDKVRPVLCLQEDVVTGAADGYARMTGAPAFTLLHVGSGFANGIAMLHTAGRANTPIVNIVGANGSYHQPNYPEHELIGGRVTDLARTVSHWSQEARSASNLGELGAEAAALAKTGKVCTVIAPTNWRWEADPPPLVPGSPGRPKTATEAIAHAAALLKNGEKTGLVLGNLALHGEALDIAGRVAAKTGAVLLSETFPSYHLCARRRPSGDQSHPAQRLQGPHHGSQRPIRQRRLDMGLQTVATGRRRLDGRDAIFQHDVVRRLLKSQAWHPPTVHQRPRPPMVVMAMAQQEGRQLLMGLTQTADRRQTGTPTVPSGGRSAPITTGRDTWR